MVRRRIGPTAHPYLGVCVKLMRAALEINQVSFAKQAAGWGCDPVFSALTGVY